MIPIGRNNKATPMNERGGEGLHSAFVSQGGGVGCHRTLGETVGLAGRLVQV